MIKRLFYLALLGLVATTLVGCAHAKDADALTAPCPNSRIWSKQIDAEQSISVERVQHVVLTDGVWQASGYYQNCFVLHRRNREPQVFWVTEVSMFQQASALGKPPPRLPKPNFHMLDADVVNDQLLITYNFYGRCWAFRIANPDNGPVVSEPSVVYRNLFVADEKISEATVGTAMESARATISAAGQLQIDCIDQRGHSHRFCLMGKAEKPAWLEQERPSSE